MLRLTTFVLLLGTGLSVLGLEARAQPAAAATARVEARLSRALDALGPDDWVRVGVTLRDDDLAPSGAARRQAVSARQQRVLDALPAGSFRLRRRYQSVAGLAGLASRAAVDALSRHPEVRSVYLDGLARPTLAQGVPQIGADRAHAQGVTGAGVAVAILDSGVDTDHPDLVDDLIAQQCFCSDPNPSPVFGSPCCPNGQATQSGPGAAEDDVGHGTSVAGIITSGGVVAPPGVAPDAGLVAIRVAGPSGALFSDIAAGLDWVLVNRDAFADPIRVVNISLSDGQDHSDPSASPCGGSNTADAIASLDAAGVAVFASSGNDGYDDGIGFPACVAQAISVGGVYDASFGSVTWCLTGDCSVTCTDTAVTQDSFVCHSNSGAILDLLAPNWRTRTCGLGGGVNTSFGGTSASSPYAAAQAALLFQADASLSPENVLGLLASSGVQVVNPDSGLSFPRSDVGDVVAALLCGNGVVESGEDCDDGGTQGGDCCAADCSFEPSGSPCDDGDACTVSDLCDGAGSCQAGTPLVCDDANLCTSDSCDPASGCIFLANTLPCDDGNACTDGDTCSGGSCQPGSPLVCDDANLCTSDSCDPASGCAFLANTLPCDDGNACTDGDACSGGSCQPGSPVDCDDGDPCTAESCDAIQGCVSTPVPNCSPPQVPMMPDAFRPLLAALLVFFASFAFGSLRATP